MKTLNINCKNCQKPLSFKIPVGTDEAVPIESFLTYHEAQVFMNHSVFCGGCKAENKLVVDSVYLKVV